MCGTGLGGLFRGLEFTVGVTLARYGWLLDGDVSIEEHHRCFGLGG